MSTLIGGFDAPSGITDGEVEVLVRPEELTLSTTWTDDAGASGVVRRVDMLGPTVLTTVELAGRTVAVRSLGVPAAGVGDPVVVRCTRTAPAVFAVED